VDDALGDAVFDSEEDSGEDRLQLGLREALAAHLSR